MRIAALTSSTNNPSRRFRVSQYIPHLSKLGVEITEFCPYFGSYPPENQFLRPFWGIASIAERIPSVISSYGYDATLLQRPLISKLLTLEGLTKKKRILDVDDCIWLRLGDFQTKLLAQSCDLIICGNTFLQAKFNQWNHNTTVIPTAIDTQRYFPSANNSNNSKKIIIGWMGTKSNLHELKEIEPALKAILAKSKSIKLRVVANQCPSFSLLPSQQVEFIPWTDTEEVKLLQDLTIGIMPLKKDSLWNQGKCSFKMLSYMACGIPVVVSPVGMNKDVLDLGNCGLPAHSQQEWIDTLEYLLDNHQIAREMGSIGRKIIINHFSLEKLSLALAKAIKT